MDANNGGCLALLGSWYYFCVLLCHGFKGKEKKGVVLLMSSWLF